MNYQVADCIIRIKNSYLAKRKDVEIPCSKLNKQILALLIREGFLRDSRQVSESGKKYMVATLRYERRIPMFTDARIISKPSLRVYMRAKTLKEGRRVQGIAVVSTNQGIMTDREAQKKGLGGEVLFRIW